METIFETIMLVCFGFSWPINVIKAYKARTTKGTSLPFIILIIVGYIAGILKKVVAHSFDFAFIMYIINIVIVTLNLVVYFRNYSLDKKNSANENK